MGLRRGAHLPDIGRWARTWIDHWVCDAWPVRRQTYGYLPSHRASPPFPGIKLYCLVTWVWTTGPELLLGSRLAGSRTRDLSITSQRPIATERPSHQPKCNRNKLHFSVIWPTLFFREDSVVQRTSADVSTSRRRRRWPTVGGRSHFRLFEAAAGSGSEHRAGTATTWPRRGGLRGWDCLTAAGSGEVDRRRLGELLQHRQRRRRRRNPVFYHVRLGASRHSARYDINKKNFIFQAP